MLMYGSRGAQSSLHVLVSGSEIYIGGRSARRDDEGPQLSEASFHRLPPDQPPLHVAPSQLGTRCHTAASAPRQEPSQRTPRATPMSICESGSRLAICARRLPLPQPPMSCPHRCGGKVPDTRYTDALPVHLPTPRSGVSSAELCLGIWGTLPGEPTRARTQMHLMHQMHQILACRASE